MVQLLDVLLDHDATSFAIGVNTLWLMLRNEARVGKDTPETGLRIADFRPQVLTMALNAGRWSTRDFKAAAGTTDSRLSSRMSEWRLTQIVLRMLVKGREDDYARETALAFSKALVHRQQDGWLDLYGKTLRPVLRELLSGFPGIAWQLIGGTIVSSPRFARLMALVLGERFVYDRGVDPPILALPEETLLAWCDVNTDQAPAFAAKCLPILSAGGSDSGHHHLHPVMSRLIDDFGERADVQEAFESNLHTTGVVSSLADHFARYEAPLKLLQGHETRRGPRLGEEAEPGTAATRRSRANRRGGAHGRAGVNATGPSPSFVIPGRCRQKDRSGGFLAWKGLSPAPACPFSAARPPCTGGP